MIEGCDAAWQQADLGEPLIHNTAINAC